MLTHASPCRATLSQRSASAAEQCTCITTAARIVLSRLMQRIRCFCGTVPNVMPRPALGRSIGKLWVAPKGQSCKYYYTTCADCCEQRFDGLSTGRKYGGLIPRNPVKVFPNTQQLRTCLRTEVTKPVFFTLPCSNTISRLGHRTVIAGLGVQCYILICAFSFIVVFFLRTVHPAARL